MDMLFVGLEGTLQAVDTINLIGHGHYLSFGSLQPFSFTFTFTSIAARVERDLSCCVPQYDYDTVRTTNSQYEQTVRSRIHSV
jgi:hypothetical protein